MQKLKKWIFLSIIVLFSLGSGFRILADNDPWFLNSNVIQGNISAGMKKILNNTVVQQTLLDIAKKPRSKHYISKLLTHSNHNISDLLDHKLIRKEKNRFVINYLLFTDRDIRRMRKITNSHAQLLANAFIKRQNEIEKIMSEYNLPGVDPRTALYITLGCFSLDWDGLAISANRGYRLKRGESNRLIVCSWEPPGLSRKEFYKGSHNATIDNITITSFGDHEIQPRKAFPDILWRIPRQAKHLNFSDSLKSSIKKVLWVSMTDLGKYISKMMMALRGGSMGLIQLADSAGIDHESAETLAGLLQEVKYIQSKGKQFQSRIPILDHRDKGMVQKILKIGHEEMKKWFDSEYGNLTDQLMEITPFRHGVSQKDYFYDIWHDIFGATNRILVKSGMFSNPYSGVFNEEGIIPVVFLKSLCDPLKL